MSYRPRPRELSLTKSLGAAIVGAGSLSYGTHRITVTNLVVDDLDRVVIELQDSAGTPHREAWPIPLWRTRTLIGGLVQDLMLTFAFARSDLLRELLPTLVGCCGVVDLLPHIGSYEIVRDGSCYYAENAVTRERFTEAFDTASAARDAAESAGCRPARPQIHNVRAGASDAADNVKRIYATLSPELRAEISDSGSH